MPTNIQVIFYSLHGHVYQLAEAIAEGARQVPDSNVELFQVAETLSADVIANMGGTDTRKAFQHVPIAQIDHLRDADAIFFGAPTRYGSAIAQMQAFFDQTGKLWGTGALVGKVGSVFTSTGTQHGGQETTCMSMYTFLIHQGMLISGCPYAEQALLNMDEITGGSPYGAATLAGPRGDRQVTENERKIARYQGRHVADIARRLKASK